MTVNMNGKTSANERRTLLSQIISRTKSPLVFCQELPGYFKRDVVPLDYDFVQTENEAAVMWRKEHFDSKSVDAGMKTTILDSSPHSLKKIDGDILSKISGRTAVVRLTAKGEEANSPKPPFFSSLVARTTLRKEWLDTVEKTNSFERPHSLFI